MVDDNQDAVLIENLAEIVAQSQGIYKGIFKIFLIHCKGLVNADSDRNDCSDPLVIFKVSGGKKIESERKKDNLNPIWKIIYPIAINMPRDMI